MRVERTSSGPRVFLVGRRIHEFHLGVAMLGILALGELAGRAEWSALGLLPLVFAIWLVVKDWRDAFPRFRDTSTWTLGVHRRTLPLRPFRATASVPRTTALAIAALGLVNLVSALTPNLAIRGHLLVQVEPVAAMQLTHALAVPASLALLAVAYYLDRRRLSAWRLSLALLAGLVVLDIAKGLDIEEAVLSVAGMALLWWGRREFAARPDPLQARAAVRRAGFLALAAFGASVVVVRLTSLGSSWSDVGREVVAAAAWQPGPIPYGDEMGHLPLSLSLLAALTMLVCLWLILRPFATPILHPGETMFEAVDGIVRRHGTGTLDYFKLRRDLQHVFDETGQAVVSYRIESGVMLCAGDPVGPSDAQERAVRAAVLLAERHGLRLGAVGVSERCAATFEAAGLRRFYLGDEAIVETASFSLEGRAIRKVRQSVSRLEREGFSFELLDPARLAPEDREQLGAVSEQWLGNDVERGFSMALDTVLGEHLRGTRIALARAADGRIRGFLHLVPTREGRVFSLSTMRRDPDTPNGLTEFLVARTIQALADEGVEEVSLNFAVLARWMQAPRTRIERLLGRLARLGNPYFQIESLYRFNSKFAPRWEPRYLVFESWGALARTALAAAWAEGQLPRPAPLLERALPAR